MRDLERPFLPKLNSGLVSFSMTSVCVAMEGNTARDFRQGGVLELL
jgi:hypothetical protein